MVVVRRKDENWRSRRKPRYRGDGSRRPALVEREIWAAFGVGIRMDHEREGLAWLR